MGTINLKIAELRKARGMTQQELGDILSVSFQTVSKWENNVTMPDITFLPLLAECFGVTVDELLGLKPLADSYQPNRSGKKDYWAQRFSYLERTRKEYWNRDYVQFLIEKVWQIETPVEVLDCGCGYGALGLLLLPLLPEGSSYTGMDFSGELLKKGRELFEKEGRCGTFIEADVLTHPVKKQYDLVICNAVLRHLDAPQAFLEKMIRYTKKGGLVVCMDVNREFECDGFYADGMDYAKLCAHQGFLEMWKKELEEQGRDYAVAMKLPHLMKKLGLKNVDARMNDRISFVPAGDRQQACVGAEPDGCGGDAAVQDLENDAERRNDFLAAQGWDRALLEEETEATVSAMVSRGMDLKDALGYCRRQNEIAAFAQKMGEAFAYTHVRGVMIAYGKKF